MSAMEKVLDVDKDSGLADGCGSDDLPQAKIVGKADVYGGETSDGKFCLLTPFFASAESDLALRSRSDCSIYFEVVAFFSMVSNNLISLQ